jgi:hypothetical protein
MVQGRDRPRLALGELLMGGFYRDDAIQARVAGFVHLTHAACSNRREDFIRTKFDANGERH